MTDIKRTPNRSKQRLTLENILVVQDMRRKGQRTFRSNLVNMDQNMKWIRNMEPCKKYNA